MIRVLAITALLLFLTGCGADNHVGSVYLDQDGNTYYTPPTPIFRDVTFTLASNHLSRSEGVTRTVSTSEDPGVDSLVVSVDQFLLEGEEPVDLISPEAGSPESGIVSFDLSSADQDVASVTLDPGDSPEGVTVHVSAIKIEGLLDHDGSTYFYDIDMNGAVEIHADLSEEDLSLDSEVTIILATSEAVTGVIPILEQAIIDEGIQPGGVIRMGEGENAELGQAVSSLFTDKLKESVSVEVVLVDDEKDLNGEETDAEEAGSGSALIQIMDEGRDKKKEDKQEVKEAKKEEKQEVKEEKKEEKQEVKEEKKEEKQEVKEEKKEEKQEVKEEKKEEKQEVKEEKKEQKQEVKEEKKGENQEVKEEKKEEKKDDKKDEKKDDGKGSGTATDEEKDKGKDKGKK